VWKRVEGVQGRRSTEETDTISLAFQELTDGSLP